MLLQSVVSCGLMKMLPLKRLCSVCVACNVADMIWLNHAYQTQCSECSVYYYRGYNIIYSSSIYWERKVPLQRLHATFYSGVYNSPCGYFLCYNSM